MKIRVSILAALTVAVISCSDGGTSVYDEWNNSALDLSAAKERCMKALSMEEPLITDFEGIDIYQYDTPKPGSDYLIPDTFHITDKSLAHAADRYNSYITIHNIWSQYELYRLFADQGYTADVVPIMEDIMGFETGSLKDEYVRNTIDKAKKELCQEIGAAYFGSMETNPTASMDAVNAYLESAPLFIPANSREQEKAIADQLSWRSYLESDYCKLTNGIRDKDSLAVIFFDAVMNASTFQEQCMIALSSVGRVPGEVVLPVMRQLLMSGRYCKYEFLMWLGWRSAEQYFFLGPSRDAHIADELYNICRREAFAATLRYCSAHPKDRTALMILEMFCSTGNIVRNGSYDSSNDAVPDYHLVFGY